MKTPKWQHISVVTDDPDGMIAHYEVDGFELVAVMPYSSGYKLYFKRLVA